MKKVICKTYEEMSRLGAYIIARQILEKPDSVLGLATGGTPVGVYANLVHMYRLGDVNFSRVTTFNLDEYYPIKKSNVQSYDYFMRDNLFNHVNIPRENIHIPNGEADDPVAEGKRYDDLMASYGGCDLQLLGIGVNGHIGFNEPDDELLNGTHVTDLTPSTIEANARFFATPNDVPTRALTMGIGNIMSAKKILLLVSGANKAPIVARLFSGRLTGHVPASLLTLHPDVTIVLDEAAAKRL